MFLLFPVQVREPNGRDTVPFANAVLIAVNVVVFFLNGYLGWPLVVGPGTGWLSILTYGFGHSGALHLLANMWVLWLFGNPVNRRLGDGWYLLAYLGTILALGLFARLFAPYHLIGSSGAVFAVIVVFLMLMPRAVVRVSLVALFPFTVLVGLVARPAHWLFWFIRWDAFELRAWVGLFVVPLVELAGLWSWGWNWTNLGHLFGLLCGLIVVLALPDRITMGRRAATAAY